MLSCLLRCVLVAIVLVAVVDSGSADQKLATCCKTVNRLEISEPITGFMMQKADLPCVQAVIFQTKSGLYCRHVKAPWVRRKIQDILRESSRSTPPATVSLLSIITSTASPPSSSAPLSFSSSSTSEIF